jgi:hypothetical protein
MTQSDANCSLHWISLMIRENTGNLRDSAALGSNWDQIGLVFSRAFDGIPYSTEQGIILVEQRIFSM